MGDIKTSTHTVKLDGHIHFLFTNIHTSSLATLALLKALTLKEGCANRVTICLLPTQKNSEKFKKKNTMKSTEMSKIKNRKRKPELTKIRA